MSTNTPAVRQAARKDVKSLLEGTAFRAEIAKVLPRHLTPERMIRVAITATMKNPKILLCTAESLTKCLLDCSALGIEPDGRRAHLIPFEDKKKGVFICTLIIDYKGLAELAMRSGMISNIHADAIRENDVFEYDLGEIKTHKINFREDRGAAYAFYAICRFKDGSVKADVMSVDEVEAIRMRSKSPNEGPWVTDPVEMAKKTVFRRLSKWLPLSPEFRDAVEKDDEADELLNVTPKPAQIAAPLFTPPQVEAAPAPQPDPEPDPQSPPPPLESDPGEAQPKTELDAKRQHIADAFTDNGVSFDAFRQWMSEKRNMQVTVDSFAELDEALVGRLMANLGPLVKQAKAFTEGGAK